MPYDPQTGKNHPIAKRLRAALIKFRRCSIKYCTTQAIERDGEYFYCADHWKEFTGEADNV